LDNLEVDGAQEAVVVVVVHHKEEVTILLEELLHLPMEAAAVAGIAATRINTKYQDDIDPV
jgi:hypothetical protein